MARLLLGLTGLVVGACLGVGLALIFVILWYDVLGIGDHGGDGMSGFATFMGLAVLLALAGGVLGAIWMARKAGNEAGGWGVTAAAIAIVMLGIGYYCWLLLTGVI